MIFGSSIHYDTEEKKKSFYSATRIPRVQWGNRMCLSVPCSIVQKLMKQACLFRGLSVQLLMVLMVGLDCRLYTEFNLWLGSILARPTTNITFPLSLSRLVLFLMS